jgi:glycosyltransferase involved in cell wall biosynthesis
MTKTHVLMIMYKYFHEDPRPQREAAALVRQGYKVDVISPRPSRGPYLERENMRFFCPVMSRKRGSRLRYMFEYGLFLVYVFFMSSWLQLRNRYGIVQVFVMPEVLLLGCILPKLLGAKVLMDWEDPSREVYLAKFPERQAGLFLRLIDLFEKTSIRIADRIVVPNIGFTKAFMQRGIPGDKIDVIMNGTDTVLFSGSDNQVRHLDENGKFVIFYNGSIIHRHGLHVLIEAMKKIVEVTDEAPLLRIIGHGEIDYMEGCKQQIAEAGLSDRVEWLDMVNIKEIPGLIANASVGVIPNLENVFTKINFPQRIFEFAILKKPLVIARMAGIEDYLSEQDLAFFTPGDHEDLADKLIELYRSEQRYRELAERIHRTCSKLEWEKPYLDLVSQMSA